MDAELNPMTTTTLPKSLAQLQAEAIPIKCCEEARAVVEMYQQAHFLRGTTEEHFVRCSKCLQPLRPMTETFLRPF